MITKNHPSAYAELFKKAVEALNKYSEHKNATISNIDEYFGYLKTLAEIENTNNLDPIFTILPATEDTFNIDANSRKISIPDNFAKNGVGVQGDEIAEILYFSIDRYFDAMDLAEMDIIVQWKHATDTSDGVNLSATYKKSLTLQPGKIVFGWPIVSEMTETPGDIQFSIRFYKRGVNESGENILVYSFSTLVAKVKIQAGQNFSEEINDMNFFNLNVIRRDDRILNNLVDSQAADVDYVVAEPTFEARWVQAEGSDELEAAQTTPYEDIVTLATKAGFASTTTGEISGNGISYSWYSSEQPNTILQGTNEYMEVKGPNVNPKEIYYVLNNGVYEPYYLDGNPFDDEGVEAVYVRYNKFTPDKAGTYYAIATNAYTHNSSKSVTSDGWTIVGATEPEFTYGDDDRKLVLDTETGKVSIVIDTIDTPSSDEWWFKENGATEASKIEGATGNTYEAAEEGYYFRKATNTKNNTSASANSLEVWVRHQASKPIITVVSNNQPLGNSLAVAVTVPEPGKGTITYQWFNIDGDIEGATDAAYTPINTGAYKCRVTNTYKETSTSVETSEWLNINPS